MQGPEQDHAPQGDEDGSRAPWPASSAPAKDTTVPVARRPRTVYLDDPTWERARAAVAFMKYFAVPGQPDTLADLVEDALRVRLTELEAEFGPFRAAGPKLGTGPGSQGRGRLSAPRKPRRPTTGVGTTSQPDTPSSITSGT